MEKEVSHLNAFGHLTGILIAVFVLFINPLLYLAQKEDSAYQIYLLTETSYLIDNIRTSGKITKKMYEDFIGKVHAIGIPMNIEFTHEHRVVNPILDEDGEFTNETGVFIRKYYKDDIVERIYDEDEIYYLNKGDTISISMRNRVDTLSAKIMNFLRIFKASGNQVSIVYGGMIRDEDY